MEKHMRWLGTVVALFVVGCDSLESRVILDSYVTYQDSYSTAPDANAWWLDTGAPGKLDVWYSELPVADAAPDASADLPLDQTDASGADLPLDQTAVSGAGLPLCPAAQGSCSQCGQCPQAPVCTLKALDQPALQTYPSACAAICALNAVDWPQDVTPSLWQGACPPCPLCSPDAMKLSDPQCVALNSGIDVTVDHACEVGCVPGAMLDPNGVPFAAKGICKQ